MIKCYINGVNYRLTEDFESVDQAAGISQSEIYVNLVNLDGSVNPVPNALDIIELKDDSIVPEEPLFFGTIGIPESPAYSSGFEPKIYKITAQSGNAILLRRRVENAWENRTTTYIVNQLFNDIIAEENITLGTISDIDYTYERYVVPSMKLTDVLDELADASGAVWTINAKKEFNFLLKSDFVTVDAPGKLTKLKKKVKSTDLRTVQSISGATERTSQQTKTIIWETDQESFAADYGIVEQPVITINGSPATVGVNGLDTGDPSKTFLFTFESPIVVLNLTATTQPAPGDSIVITYFGQYRVKAVAENTAKIAEIATRTGTSGKIENLRIDSNISSLNDASNLSNALLANFGDEEDELTCYTKFIEDTEPLKIWRFNRPDLDIEGDFVIAERRVEYLIDNQGADKDVYRIRVKLKNKNYEQKYGSILNRITKDINNISVRADEIVVNVVVINDTIELSEELDFEESVVIQYYPSDGSDFSVPFLEDPFYPIQ